MVKITVADKVTVESPYNPDFPKAARRLNGKWSSSKRVWTFDARDERRVRELCKSIYGYDGNGGGDSVDLVTVQVTYSNIKTQTLWRFGRQVANRPGRDAEVKLGSGTVILSGSFRGRGGSRNYPVIGQSSGEEPVVLEVRDVPRSLVEADDGDYQVIEEKPATVSKFVRFSDEELITELQGRGYEVTK